MAINDISFGKKITELGIKTYVDGLRNYRETLPTVLDLRKRIPIFLDTNVLLRWYSISLKSRQQLLAFLRKHKKRIYITAQVQREFVKNREDLIKRFSEETLIDLGNSYKKDISNKLKSFREHNKVFLEDFPSVETKLSKVSDDVEKIIEQLEKQILDIQKKLPVATEEDDLLTLVSEMNLLSNLSDEDVKYLKVEFDNLKKGLDVSKIKSEISKPNRAFPGLADITEKPDYPYGDYLLYHEMLLFLKESKKDAIFLTYDTTKGDWLQFNKTPHSHYIQVTFLSTKQNLFFVDADRFFNQHLKQHFKSLVATPADYYSPKSDSEKEFILSFVGLERIIRTIAEFVVIEKYDIVPVTRIIREFLNRGYIDESFLNEFYELSRFKNFLTHAHDRELIDEIEELDFQNWLFRIEIAITRMKDLYSQL